MRPTISPFGRIALVIALFAGVAVSRSDVSLFTSDMYAGSEEAAFTLPEIPKLPALPALPRMPGVPSLPQLPDLPDLPERPHDVVPTTATPTTVVSMPPDAPAPTTVPPSSPPAFSCTPSTIVYRPGDIPEGIDAVAAELTVEIAVETFATAIARPVSLTVGGPVGSADTVIEWGPLSGSRVGEATRWTSGSGYDHGTIVVDNTEWLNPANGAAGGLHALLLHELGHLAELDHVAQNADSVMTPVLDGTRPPVYGDGDLALLARAGVCEL